VVGVGTAVKRNGAARATNPECLGQRSNTRDREGTYDIQTVILLACSFLTNQRRGGTFCMLMTYQLSVTYDPDDPIPQDKFKRGIIST